MKALPNSFSCEPRTLRQFGFELFTLLLVWSGTAQCFSVSMLGDLESAARSSGERWGFVTSGRFLAVFLGYFLLAVMLHLLLDVRTDISLEIVKIISVGLMFCVIFFAQPAILAAHAAIKKIVSEFWSKFESVFDQFTDFLAPIYTPPPIRFA